MASFIAKRVVRQVAEIAGCSEEKVDKLGRIAKWTTAVVTGDVAGVLADRAVRKHYEDKDYEQKCPVLHSDILHYDSDGDEELEGQQTDNEGPYKELASIQPFLNMAQAAYEDTSMEKFSFVKRSQLVKDLKNPTQLKWVITTDTKVHVSVLEDGSLTFTFRGTEPVNWKHPMSDLVTDLMQNQLPVELYNASNDVAYKADSSVKAHKGFQLAFRDVTKTHSHDENLRLVAEGLGVKAQDVKRVVCIGHSLGGALATLCAHWCRKVAYPHTEIWCVTIGSPRVGNCAFAKDFNEFVVTKGRSYRVVNKGDVVPSIPHLYSYPKVWSAYKHVDGLIYLSEHPTSKDTIFLKRGGRRPSFVRLSFLDHPCIAYINSIDKVLATFSHYEHQRITLPPT